MFLQKRKLQIWGVPMWKFRLGVPMDFDLGSFWSSPLGIGYTFTIMSFHIYISCYKVKWTFDVNSIQICDCGSNVIKTRLKRWPTNVGGLPNPLVWNLDRPLILNINIVFQNLNPLLMQKFASYTIISHKQINRFFHTDKFWINYYHDWRARYIVAIALLIAPILKSHTHCNF